ncbi:MAG: hypothetical protein ACFE89_06450 [Candidatus Hodarchaeota archaeon]
MGKDSTTNILFGIGTIGALILLIANAFVLYSLLFALPSVAIMGWIVVLGSILVILGLTGLYRQTENKSLLIAIILYLILQILIILIQFDILFPLLVPIMGFDTANRMLNWIFWIFYLLIYLIFGYNAWTTRDDIGIIASITGILLMAWSVLNLVFQFIEYGVPPSIWSQIWAAGLVIVWLFIFIYFIKAFRD